MPDRYDIHLCATKLYFLPVQTRVPIKFGIESVTAVNCARVQVHVADRNGKRAVGWGETPLSVQWVWPGTLSYDLRLEVISRFCVMLAKAWADFEGEGHPLEIGHAFQEQVLPRLLKEINTSVNEDEQMPWLAALVCCSAFDIALHDAYGVLHHKPVYQTYNAEYMNGDLSTFLTPAGDADVSFADQYPQDFLDPDPPTRLPAWHLVGGLDPLNPSQLTGSEPDDGYPVLLPQWIERDGLNCLKIKLCGNDTAWDYQRILDVGDIAIEHRAQHLSVDFNCTVSEPQYVNEILDHLDRDRPDIHRMILYVEQPFAYDLEAHRIDVRSVSARKPLFMDESAHDWRLVKLGRELGWSGVALKTCKTQTGAILSLCWARAHGIPLMVQDLSNPMLAMVPHALLAAHARTIMGVETNAMQFYPDASQPEAAVHPGLYRRREGRIDLGTLDGNGFGYRLQEMTRELPEPVASFGG